MFIETLLNCRCFLQTEKNVHHWPYIYLKHFTFETSLYRPNWPVGHCVQGQEWSERVCLGQREREHASECASECMECVVRVWEKDFEVESVQRRKDCVCVCVCVPPKHYSIDWLLWMNNCCLPHLPPPTMTRADGLFIKTFVFVFSLSLSYSVNATPCTITCINICAHVKITTQTPAAIYHCLDTRKYCTHW